VNTATNANVVVLSEDEAAMQLVSRTSAATSVKRYANVKEMIAAQPLSSIAVLIIDAQPKGVLLATLGRINVEYPAMQKIALMDAPPALPVASYLAACGVDLVWRRAGEDSTDKLAAVVDRTCERAKWLAN
jgi:hypothetical protein